MNDMTPCGNYEALIAYVYDECEPAERESIAAHLALCASCTEEIQALRDTRAHLGAWTPPSLPLGFQITRAESDTPANVLRPANWWRQPLPAWAQVAAAVAIFAAGMSVNVDRSTAGTTNQAAVAVARPVAAPAVSRDELARLAARIQSVETAQAQALPAQLQRTAAPAIDEGALLARVSALVDERLAQSQRQNLRMIASVENRIDDTRGAMEEEFLTYRQDIRRALPSLVRVSAPGAR